MSNQQKVDEWDWEGDDDFTLEDPTPDYERFLNRHIRQIVTDGDWEYDTGLDMTPDAQAFITHYDSLVAKLSELEEKP